MNVIHGDHQHEVFLEDDGTLDTVISVDGREVRYAEAKRHKDGSVRASWLRQAAVEACDDGFLDGLNTDEEEIES